VADIIRAAGDSFIGRNQSHLGWQQLQMLRTIKRCRTAALGGHLDQCSRCGHRAISFFSCRNRHCPKCQTNAGNRWLAARSHELLGVSYFHVVFTLPQELSVLALQNKGTTEIAELPPASRWMSRSPSYPIPAGEAAATRVRPTSYPHPSSKRPRNCRPVAAIDESGFSGVFYHG
jgi:hypothetical protein